MARRVSLAVGVFQSTLSVRRATVSADRGVTECHISIHALRKESDFVDRVQEGGATEFQSTLSVRRATPRSATMPSRDYRFQSTLSVRRATSPTDEFKTWAEISIHALRKESDRHATRH